MPVLQWIQPMVPISFRQSPRGGNVASWQLREQRAPARQSGRAQQKPRCCQVLRCLEAGNPRPMQSSLGYCPARWVLPYCSTAPYLELQVGERAGGEGDAGCCQMLHQCRILHAVDPCGPWGRMSTCAHDFHEHMILMSCPQGTGAGGSCHAGSQRRMAPALFTSAG